MEIRPVQAEPSPKKGEVQPKGRTSILRKECFAFHAETFFQRPGARKRGLFEPGRPPQKGLKRGPKTEPLYSVRSRKVAQTVSPQVQADAGPT